MEEDWGTRAGRWAGIRTDWVDVAGTRVRVLHAPGRANGPPHLLVHGLGGSATNWLEVMPALSELGAVVAPDLPGFGRTEPPSAHAAGIPAQARFVPALCRALGLDRVVMHGNSMGGVIAVLVAAERPELIGRLVLADPALPPRRLHTHRIHPRTMARFVVFAVPGLGERVLAGLWDRYTPEQVWDDSRDFLYGDPERLTPELAEVGIAGIAEGLDAAWRMPSFAAAAESLVGTILRPRRLLRALDAIVAPTLTLWGEADKLVGRAIREAVSHRRPDWDVRLLAGVGHCPQMEVPAQYLDVVCGWLARDRDHASLPA